MSSDQRCARRCHQRALDFVACPGVVKESARRRDELLTLCRFSLPTEDAARVPLFSLVASGQITLRTVDGGQKIGAVVNQPTPVAA